MSIKVGIVSLGCPKNQVDAEIMVSKLIQAGFEITPVESEAEVIIVNTCGFILSAKMESIETIMELGENKKDGNLKLLVVTGCLSQRFKEEILNDIDEVDVVVTLGANENIADIINEALSSEKSFFNADVNLLPLNGERTLLNEPYYAYLKIAEGCNNRCSYCAIPYIRGNMRSRKIEDIISEAQTLASNGVKELIVVAQDTTRYGEDIYEDIDISDLLRALCKIEKLHWIRLLYAYPERVTDKLINTIATEPKIVNYLDIPIQHCETEILKNMNRKSDKQSLVTLIDKLRSAIPDIVIRTTLITGFPGETDSQFESLCEFVENSQFDRLGCFAYSAEEGTPAASFDNQLSEKVKQKRADIIMEQQSVTAARLAEQKIGTELEVLVEGYDSYIKHFFGRSYADAPDIDCKVFFTSKDKNLQAGEFVTVKITDVMDYDLMGERTE